MHQDWQAIKQNITQWGKSLGFSAIGFARASVTSTAKQHLADWLAADFHGDMHYMALHKLKRTQPAQLFPDSQSIITAQMNYLPASITPPAAHAKKPRPSATESTPDAAISRYAWGRDYHKVLRQRLQTLAAHIQTELAPCSTRVFTDSAPVMEVEHACQSGLGWRGKHTLLLNREAGSWFFLGEIYCTLPIPADKPTTDHCGTCHACLDACPTSAIIAPYVLDARRCISYLTIEHKGAIPLELRPLIGNRIYGCDDCQLCCPWNKDAPITNIPDFAARHGLDNSRLVDLFLWNEETFMQRLSGSAIRRIGHQRWLRNIAVALGNAPPDADIKAALQQRQTHSSALVREHVAWALAQQE